MNLIKKEVSQFKPPYPLETPVLFLVFNRLDTTIQVFEAIRQARPPRLYVAADGPRSNDVLEAEKIQAVRDYIMQHIDWICDVRTLFRDKNLGCKNAVSGAINWFFENEEQGIILEEDCLPSQSFFWFCEILLNRYKGDSRVDSICGRNHLGRWMSDDYDYFFTTGSMWGWATWAEVWRGFKINEILQKDRKSLNSNTIWLRDKGLKIKQEEVLLGVLRSASGAISSWAYPWSYYRISRQSLNIISSLNLIKNIGSGIEATHTNDFVDDVPIYEIDVANLYALRPSFYAVDAIYMKKVILRNRSLKKRIKRRLKSMFNSLMQWK